MPTARNIPSIPKVRDSSGTMGTTLRPTCLSLSIMFMMRTMAMVVDSSRPSPDALSKASKDDRGGIANGSALRRRWGRKPPSAMRRSSMYLCSAESSGNFRYGRASISSSFTGSEKRSRKRAICSLSIFFCWCEVFMASPALPMPKPLMVLARMSVG